MRPHLPIAIGPVLMGLAILAFVVPSRAHLASAQVLPSIDAAEGRMLFVKDGNLWIWTDGRTRQLTKGETWRQPQWSPDGSEIAFVYRSTHFSEIFVMNADGTNHRRLTRGQSSSLADNDWAFRPTWSPDGAQLAFISDGESYNPTVWLMNRDGSAARQVPVPSAVQEAADALSWSPDGRRLAVAAFGQEVSQILLVDVPRGTFQPATDSPRGALDPAWSPDGSTLAYAVREAGRMDVRLRRLDGSTEVEVSRGGFARAPAWSPDGGRLAYLSSRSGTFEVYVVDVVADGPAISLRNERQLTRDLNIDAPSGLSWGK